MLGLCAYQLLACATVPGLPNCHHRQWHDHAPVLVPCSGSSLGGGVCCHHGPLPCTAPHDAASPGCAAAGTAPGHRSWRHPLPLKPEKGACSRLNRVGISTQHACSSYIPRMKVVMRLKLVSATSPVFQHTARGQIASYSCHLTAATSTAQITIRRVCWLPALIQWPA